MNVEVLVAGGGPAGLAVAIEARALGLEVVVCERAPAPYDKACGEGVMPSGVRWLASRGVLDAIAPAECRWLEGVRYRQQGTRVLQARFHAGLGLGVRRTVLVSAMRRRFEALGGSLVGGSVRLVSNGPQEVSAECDGRPLTARILVAADGLSSPLRTALGIRRRVGSTRIGLRRHYAFESPPFVEVDWVDGAEAYVTPVGRGLSCVALLFEPGAARDGSFEGRLAAFPRLAARLATTAPHSALRGAGPMSQAVERATSGRIALVGDAAGSVDAIAGRGLSLAFASAELLAKRLPEALGAGAPALEGYACDHAKLFRSEARRAGPLVWLAAHPQLRRPALQLCERWPPLFDRALRLLG